MITIYGMNTCPDCVVIKKQIAGREEEFTYKEIGEHVKILKEYLHLRDTKDVFEEAKKNGQAGIPCFVFENGNVSLNPEDAGLKKEEPEKGMSCSIEDHLNHKGGC